ncbi:DUF2283 domain-containing protein [Archaeoglobus sp.]
MKVKYDIKSDILYLKISESKPVDSEMVNDDVVVHLDEKGNIVGIEIWRVRELILPQFLNLIRHVKSV